MLSTLPLFYVAQSVNSDDRRARFQGLRVIMVMLYSQHFTFHWKLLVLVSRIEKSGTEDSNFGKWKGTFRSHRPKTVDHLQSWSRIFQSDQTEMVRSIWWTNRNFRTFGLNGKRPSFLSTIPPHLQLISSTITTPKCTLRSVLFTVTSPHLWVFDFKEIRIFGLHVITCSRYERPGSNAEKRCI